MVVLLNQACDNESWYVLYGVNSKGLALFMLDEKEMTCCFTGHRIIPKHKEYEIFKKTKDAVISLIEKGVKYFGTGGAIGYNKIVA